MTTVVTVWQEPYLWQLYIEALREEVGDEMLLTTCIYIGMLPKKMKISTWTDERIGVLDEGDR